MINFKKKVLLWEVDPIYILNDQKYEYNEMGMNLFYSAYMINHKPTHLSIAIALTTGQQIYEFDKKHNYEKYIQISTNVPSFCLVIC